MSTSTTDPAESQNYDVVNGSANVYFAVYGVVLPILAIHGFCTNVVTVIVYQLPKLKGPNTPYVVAMLAADCLFLACTLAMYTPSSWVFHVHGEPTAYDTRLWHLQRMFTKVYPCYLIAQTMVVWLTFTYIIEQYNLMSSPLRSITWAKRNMGIKILFTVFSVSVIIHMLHFFKFTIEKMRYGLQGRVWRQVCLSDLFAQPSYQSADKWGYFLLFEVLPWVLSLILLLFILKIVWSNKRAHLRLDTPAMSFDPSQMRIFKRGRSLRSVVAITCCYLTLHAVSSGMYIAAVDSMYAETDTVECHLGVTDFKFAAEPQSIEMIYVMSQTLYCCTKFWVLFVCCSSFRQVFYQWIKFQGRLMKQCAWSAFMLVRRHDFKEQTERYLSYRQRGHHRHHGRHREMDDVYSIASGSTDENPYYKPNSSDTTMDSWTMELSEYNQKKAPTYTRMTYI